MTISLDRGIRLTVRFHEWYWAQVWYEYKGRQSLPRLYALHTFYAQYQDQLVDFENYANWEAVIRRLGCPVTWKGTLGAFLSFNERYHRVRECFTDPKKKRKKSRWPWYRRFGGKWEKRWEPSPEEREQKREAREKKAQWREQIGKTRDCRNRADWPRRCNPGKYHKQRRNREHRQWVRREIDREHWDVFWQSERSQFEDPWMYD